MRAHRCLSLNSGWIIAVLAGMALSGGATRMAAQSPAPDFRRAFRFAAGPSFYDFDSRTGTALTAAIGLSSSVSRHLLIEVNLSVFDGDVQPDFAGTPAANRIRLLLPEVGAQLQTGSGVVRGYLAAGGGAAIHLDGEVQGGATLHTALGTRLFVSRRLDLRVEVRGRTIRPFNDWTVDATVGVEIVKW